MNIHLTPSKYRRIAALVLFVLSCVVFVAYPDALRGVGHGLPAPLSFALPAFVALTLACLLLETKQPRSFLVIIPKLILLAICCLLLLFASEILANGDMWRVATNQRYAFVYGLGIVLFVVLFFFGLLGSLPWGLRIATVLFMLLGLVSYFVLKFRGAPFEPMDVLGTRTAFIVLPSYTFRPSRELGEALLIYLCVFLIAFRTALPALRPLAYWTLRLLACVCAIGFFGVTTTSRHVYEMALQPDIWDQNVSAKRFGSVANFFSNIPGLIIRPPAGYSAAMVQSIAEQYQTDSVADAYERPDVILILGESWADLAPQGVVKTNVPATPTFWSFKDRTDGYLGKLISPLYGGGTSCTEFEVLSGASRALGMYTAPYQMHAKTPIPCLPAYFKQMGYKTIAVHNGEVEAWNRDKAYPNLGFDKFYGREDIESRDDRYIRTFLWDKALYRAGLSLLEKTEEPLFLFMLTIQSHGGYDFPDYESKVRIEEPKGKYPLAEQYLGVMNDCDKEFGEFIKALEKRKRPTIVVAFGDHLPAVETDYRRKVVTPGYGPLWLFGTYYVAWSNFSAPIEAKPMVSANYLGALLAKSAELPLTGFQKFQLECAKDAPVISGIGIQDSTGTLYPLGVGKRMPLIGQQAMLQYSLIMDDKNLPKDFFSLKPAE